MTAFDFLLLALLAVGGFTIVRLATFFTASLVVLFSVFVGVFFAAVAMVRIIRASLIVIFFTASLLTVARILKPTAFTGVAGSFFVLRARVVGFRFGAESISTTGKERSAIDTCIVSHRTSKFFLCPQI